MNGSVSHSTWLVSLFGVRPLIRHALRRATLSVGEGDLPAGASSGGGVLLPSPGGRWPPQRPEEGRCQVGPCAAPHPSGLRPATLSQERVFYAIYASRSESFLTIREVMRNSTATKAKKPHWALVVSEVAMKS